MSALTTRDRSRIRYHLGYLAVGPAASLSFGLPRPINTMFMVEDSMNNLIDDGWNVENVLRIIGILDGIECRLVAAQDYLSASELGSLKVRPDQTQALEIEYCRWMARLADILGVPSYPYSQRAQQMAGMFSGNIRVRH